MNDNDLACTFCRKGRRDVRKLVAGPGVYICDECVELCSDIVEELAGEERSPGVIVLDPRANALVPRARRLVESCHRALELLQPVAERARALADTIELALAKSGSRVVFDEYANSVAFTARQFAKACGALELPYHVEKLSRTVAGEIDAVVAGYLVQRRGDLVVWARERPHFEAPARDAGRIIALEKKSELECTFCRRGRREVRKLIAGPGVYICDECAGLCFGIIEEGVAGEGQSPEVSLLDRHANGLVARARRLMDSCNRMVELPEPVAERARALAEEIELFVSAIAESWMAFTEYANSFAITARHFAKACDALELSRVADRSRALGKEIEALVAGPHQ